MLQHAVASETAERLKQAWVPPFVLSNSLYKSAVGSQSWHYRGTLTFHGPHTIDVVVPRGASDLSVQVPRGISLFLFFKKKTKNCLFKFFAQSCASTGRRRPRL